LAKESDAALLQTLAAGERAALGALYDRYAVTLLTLAQRLLGTRTEAEDLVHDLFLEVWLRADTYDASRASVRTWLLLRLRSRALDRLKSAAWRLTVSSPAGPEGQDHQPAAALVSDPEPELTRRATLATVRSAVRQLSEDEQLLIDLIYVRGIALVEVAGQLAAPVGTVKSRLSRVLGKLRSSLAPPSIEV
jgi:RNA polymerase sigma-70 factor (ECF subfamily)